MQVICLEDTAFYELVDQVVEKLKERHSISKKKWLSEEEAFELLPITSKTTLQKLRDDGEIRFSQPFKKVIAYDAESIEMYLERHVKNPVKHGRQ